MMKEHQTCLSILLACSMVGLVLAGANGCTPTTCPPGPVSVDFPNSDCTGTPSYYYVTEESGVCNDGYQMLADEEGITFLRFYDGNIQCDRERTNTSYNVDIYKYVNVFIMTSAAKRSLV